MSIIIRQPYDIYHDLHFANGMLHALYIEQMILGLPRTIYQLSIIGDRVVVVT